MARVLVDASTSIPRSAVYQGQRRAGTIAWHFGARGSRQGNGAFAQAVQTRCGADLEAQVFAHQARHDDIDAVHVGPNDSVYAPEQYSGLEW